MPTSRDKTRAVFLAYEAESLLRRGEIDHSAVTAHQALLLAQRIGASRCIRQINDLTPSFQPHQAVQDVKQFLNTVRSTT
ncbi:hypothetical protein OG609_44900 (plasmid) [Streptomyces sp. NBC_01224]|uniref:hypothetical protein n=1 Tax=Streptomyces sp. NBC_01224 TaxID=2903783 RepID=UPI002E0EABFD|nr:hypothetical protein OG609_44900 [Streptomyces sp. NBC_01224]